MKQGVFISMEKLKHRCAPSKSMQNRDDAIGEKTISSWYNNSDNLDYIQDILSHAHGTFLVLVRDNNGDSYSIYFDTENNICEISSFYLNINSENSRHYYMYYIQYSWCNHINNCIDKFISINTYNYCDSYIYSFICAESVSNFGPREREEEEKLGEEEEDRARARAAYLRQMKFAHLWVLCENCYELNYKKFLREEMTICEHCGYHLQMSISDRIELLIDPGTWNLMGEDLVSGDPIEFHSEEDPYKDRINYYKQKTGLTEAVQTGIGRLNGITIAMGVMEFQFMGGSMGSVVGERITRLIEYAAKQALPIIIVCASGGARMQEGSLSLIQMAKISSALYNYQSIKKLFYVSILTSPTTGGVTASFGMLGDVIIAEPNAYIAFAGKRVIEQTLHKEVPEGSQETENLFAKGLFDSIVPRNPLKCVLSELLQFHGFFPLRGFLPLPSPKFLPLPLPKFLPLPLNQND